ncbi:TlpA family protein disulfide reductase [Aliikangiella coralliicola]|nr:TlpA disulfide reductase family protein [Aliikangiella coralliicola]
MKLWFKLLGLLALVASISVAQAKNEPAPAFTLSDIYSGKKVSLSDYAGKVVYVDFWASWCGPCRKSFPAMEEIYQANKAKGFEVITVNLDDNAGLGKEFLKSFKVSFTNLYDDKKQTPSAYQVATMPSSFLIDKKGKIRLRHQGYKKSDKAKLDQAIKILLSE